MKLSQRLKILFEESKLTLKEFGKIIGVGESTISMYLSGKRIPSDEKKIKIASYFDISIDWLLGNSDIREIKKGQKKDEEKNLKDKQILKIYKEYEDKITPADLEALLKVVARTKKQNHGENDNQD
jgi:transcriptional regulator with XRE-family HTH domain